MPPSELKARIISVRFKNYKALKDFEVRLSDVNILVGPNNAGKSTLIGAFRVLAIALRRMKGKRPEIVSGPDGRRYGVSIPTDFLPISIENVHTDYTDSDTIVTFILSNRNELQLYFPLDGPCVLIAETHNVPLTSAAAFRKAFPIDIAIVPVLGPVEHREKLVQEETVRDNLATHRASRNFRNYWYHYPDNFNEFADLVSQTWPGIGVEAPGLANHADSTLAMFCTERRIPRELYWVGSGFQVWCQLLTHLLRTRDASIVVVDEPEIYLHADLQRQLVGLLKSFEADVLIATHSTEIMSEAEPSDLILIDKRNKIGERLKNIERLQSALTAVGSAQNVTLSRLARARRILFIEGDRDFKLLRMFARQCGYLSLASGLEILPIPSGGFGSWEKVAGTGWGIAKALDDQLAVGALYDRDFFSDGQIELVEEALRKELSFVHIHKRKEIENYLLLPSSLDKALASEVKDKYARQGKPMPELPSLKEKLVEITDRYKEHTASQRIGNETEEKRLAGTKEHASTLYSKARASFDLRWASLEGRLELVPGKAVLSDLRTFTNETFGASLSDHRIINATNATEMPSDFLDLLEKLDDFRKNFKALNQRVSDE